MVATGAGLEDGASVGVAVALGDFEAPLVPPQLRSSSAAPAKQRQ